MKNHAFLSTAILMGGLTLASCGTAPGDATEMTDMQMQENMQEMDAAKTASHEAWHAERDEARNELSDLRATFVEQRAKEQAELDGGIKDATKKAECQNRIAELDKNIARIDAGIVKLDASTGINWNDVKRETSEVANDTKNWWQRQKEAVDKKTDVDHDKDGH